MNEHTREASFYQPLPLGHKAMRGSSLGGFPTCQPEQGGYKLGTSLVTSASHHQALHMVSRDE